MKSLATVLTSLDRTSFSEQSGKRYIITGQGEFFRNTIRRQLARLVTDVIEFEVDATAIRSSALTLRDTLQTSTLPWERHLIWIKNGDLLLANMAYPEDLPVSGHIVGLTSDSEQIYQPPSSTVVSLALKGAGQPLQDIIKWMLIRKGLAGEVDAVRFLAQEYKDSEDLSPLDRLLDVIGLTIFPRTVVTLTDLDEKDEGWDTTVLITAIQENNELKLLTEMARALETFSPKGILTVLTRRVTVLIQVAHANVMSGGIPDMNSEVKPWVWKQNSEFLKNVPLKRLAQWAIQLDKGYALLSSKSRLPARWQLMLTLLEMARS